MLLLLRLWKSKVVTSCAGDPMVLLELLGISPGVLAKSQA